MTIVVHQLMDVLKLLPPAHSAARVPRRVPSALSARTITLPVEQTVLKQG
jgi:hypothetical protein